MGSEINSKGTCSKGKIRAVEQDNDGQNTKKDTETPNPTYWYIHGQPYDLTEWAKKHPGGPEIIQACQGTDCTVLYETYHAPSLQRKWIDSLRSHYQAPAYVPRIVKNPGWAQTPVYDDLRNIVIQYRKEHGIKATPTAYVWYVCMATIHYRCLYHWLSGQGSWWTPLWLGITIWLWSEDMVHSGTHYALCKSPWLSRTIGMVGGWMFCLPHTWIRHHVISHHANTNTPSDHDTCWDGLLIVAPWEQKPSEKLDYLWYFAPAYLQIGISLGDTLEVLNQGHWDGVGDAKNPFYPGEKLTMWGAWLAYVSMLLGVGVFHGFGWAILPSIEIGCILYFISQVSHINTASFDTPATKEWAVKEITTCQGDFAYDSLLWNKLTCGLNNQTMHHLFPSIHPCHYPELSKHVRKVFEKHRLPQTGWVQTYWGSLQQHYMWVCHLNGNSTPKTGESCSYQPLMALIVMVFARLFLQWLDLQP